MDATRTIPIVIGASGDPVLLGFVASIRRPGGNVTGVAIRGETLSAKRLQLLKQAFPGIASASVLRNPQNVAAASYLHATRVAAETLGLRLAPFAASTPEELRALGAADLARSDSLVVLPDAMFCNQRATIVALGQTARMPAIYPEREYADDGGLVAYGPNIPDGFRLAAATSIAFYAGPNPVTCRSTSRPSSTSSSTCGQRARSASRSLLIFSQPPMR
jgi:putative ABC transport system substrate-binding protein